MKKITELSQLDVNGVYSYADYLTWHFEQAVELIKGKIFPMAAPNRRHQGISWQFTLIIGETFQNQPCKAYAAPFDVRLFDKKKSAKAQKDIFTVVQPDICIVCDLEKLDDKGCLGAPDLIIEILSPANSSKELKTKKDLYEENKVREYWIIDPEHESVILYALQNDGAYSSPKIIVSEDMIASAIFPELNFNLSDLFDKL